MKIEVDDEGRSILVRVCDSALREGGVNALNDVNRVMSCIAKKEENENRNSKSSKAG